jgi:hypothetical protein
LIDSTITLISNSEGDVTGDADCIDVRLEYVRICQYAVRLSAEEIFKKKGSNLEPHPFQVNYQPFFFLQVKLDDDNINHYIIL